MNDEELEAEARRLCMVHGGGRTEEGDYCQCEEILAALKKAREDGKVEGRIEIDREVEQLQLADWDRGRKLGMEEAAEIARKAASEFVRDGYEYHRCFAEIKKRIAEIEKEKGLG